MKKLFILVAIIMYCFMDIGFCADGFYVIPVGKSRYAIGDTGPAGGIVFYITPSSGGKHGLEAALSDQSSNAAWGCYGTVIAGADGTAVGTGAQNSLAILVGCGESGIAAKIAVSYAPNGISGWFLPSKNELNELYLNKGVVGGFADDFYWSSSQHTADPDHSDDSAELQHFNDGEMGLLQKSFMARVRAVRAF